MKKKEENYSTSTIINFLDAKRITLSAQNIMAYCVKSNLE